MTRVPGNEKSEINETNDWNSFQQDVVNRTKRLVGVKGTAFRERGSRELTRHNNKRAQESLELGKRGSCLTAMQRSWIHEEQK